MRPRDTEPYLAQSQDKQLQGISLESVLEKRRQGQALNAKEFAVCAGVSYSKTRSWFHLPGFPVLDGVVFWRDFIQWRANRVGLTAPPNCQEQGGAVGLNLPPRATQILLDS